MTATRVAFQAAMRQAAVDLVQGYADDLDEKIKVQIYPGRPRSIFPPTAFVDRIRESVTYLGPTNRQRIVTVDLVIVHGIFDSADAAAQKDAFVDGFLDWVTDNYHAAGANTLIGQVSTEDDPNWIPDWLPLENQKQYYATVISLEGLAQD